MKKLVTILVVGAALMVSIGSAEAGDKWSIQIGGGYYGGHYSSSGSYSFYYNSPGYYSFSNSGYCAPAPRYYCPPVNYCPPRPVYYYTPNYYHPSGVTIQYSNRRHCR